MILRFKNFRCTQQKSLSFFEYVDQSLKTYRWIIAIIMALIISLVFSGIVLSNKLSNDQQIIDAISPYLITLLESSDRPEMLRVVHSIAESKKLDRMDVNIFIVKDNIVWATNLATSILDTQIKNQEWMNAFAFNIPFINSKITSSKIIFKKSIFSTNNQLLANIYIISPLFSSVKISILMMFVIIPVDFRILQNQ